MKQLKLTNTPLIDNVDRLPVNHNQYERDQLKAELNDRNKQYLSLQTTIAFIDRGPCYGVLTHENRI